MDHPIIPGMAVRDPVTGRTFRYVGARDPEFHNLATRVLNFVEYHPETGVESHHLRLPDPLPFRLGAGSAETEAAQSTLTRWSLLRAWQSGPDNTDPLTGEILRLRKRTADLEGKIRALLLDRP